MSKSVNRLYKSFRPKEYTVKLNIDKDKLEFEGIVLITGVKTGPLASRITLHQKDLNITDAQIDKVEKGKAVKIKVKRYLSHKAYDELRIHSEEKLSNGEYIVTVRFNGKINEQLHGIYPCNYKNNGKKDVLIATQFESHFAREAFPCIDEPEAKAIFNLVIGSGLKDKVISNTEIQKEVKKDKRKYTYFYPSPVMSTYLLAFCLGDIHSVSQKSKNNIQINCWSTVAQPKNYLSYSLKEAADILDFFEDYFETPFPLKKLDLIALPDFEAGAMENWGLITFREVLLLTDPDNRSISSEQTISLVIAHEISHQWFGNLVTMKWWDDLWLNESFASIMENIAPDRLHPEWQQWEDFTISRVLSCSHRDIYKDVQPVGVTVKHPDEIITLFDPSIVYAKGARLLSMLLEYIGEKSFRDGLKLYFNKHKFGNTTRDDLWTALSKTSGQDIEKLMTPWLTQSGQPLLSVRNDKDKIIFNQNRFLMDGKDEDSIWPIPLLADKQLTPNIVKKREQKINYSQSNYPIFNVNGSGHYIVKYLDKKVFADINNKVVRRQVSSISRITLLNDMLLLARHGDYKLTDLNELIMKCNDEPRDAVWSLMNRIMAQAQLLTDGDSVTEKHIRSAKAKLGKYWFNKLGWLDKKDDDTNTKHLRTTAIGLSLTGEDKSAISQALHQFKNQKSVEKLPAELRGLIATTAVIHGEPKYIKQIMDEYEHTQNSDVQHAITAALCSTRDPKVAEKIIKWGLSEKSSVIRHQDIDRWYAYLMRNRHTRDLAWSWFTSNWDYLSKVFSGGKHMDFFIWYSAGPLSTKAWQKKFKDFFKKLENEPALKRNILIAYSEIDARIKWREREEKQLVKFFTRY